MTTPDTGSHNGTDRHEGDTVNRRDNGTSGTGDDRDVTDRTNDTMRRADETIRRARQISRSLRTPERTSDRQDTPARHTTTTADETGRRTHKVAGGGDRIDSQDGFSFGGDRRHHGGSDTGESGDVTDREPTAHRVRHIVINGDFHAGPTCN